MKNLFTLLILCTTLFVGMPAFADLDKGWDAYEKGDYETALREFQPLAEQGDAVAQYFLGLLYYNGFGVVQDYQQALKWYTLSAEQGDSDAQYNLGVIYSNG